MKKKTQSPRKALNLPAVWKTGDAAKPERTMFEIRRDILRKLTVRIRNEFFPWPPEANLQPRNPVCPQ